MVLNPLRTLDVAPDIHNRQIMVASGVNPDDPKQVALYYKERDRIEAKKEAELKESKRLERQANAKYAKSLNARLEKRYRIPEEYVPPKDFDEIKSRIKSGESYFEGIEIDGKNISFDKNLDLSGCNFRNSEFTNISFIKDAIFRQADFENSKFSNVIFGEKCDCSEVSFDSSKLSATVFHNDCDVSRSSFNYAKFDVNSQLEFDQNIVLHTVFKMPKNRWQILSESYSGMQQFLNIAFGLAYFTILLTKIMVLAMLSDFQNKLTEVNLDTELSIFNLSESETVWAIAFGGASPTTLSLTIAFLILAYQGGRYSVTSRIAPLIESQKIDGHTPTKDAYEGLFRTDKWVKPVGWIALSLFAIDLVYALFAKIHPLSLNSAIFKSFL